MDNPKNIRIIFSGGGTGGHIFPAIAIADRVKSLCPNADIRFVGAQGRMEMERVPKAGYPIDGLWISGLQRKLTLQNLLFPFKVISSLWKADSILRSFRPHVAVGTGGYASGPLLRRAAKRGIPCLIQEQNAYAGLTNKWLAPIVQRICVAYPGMEKYFPADKVLNAGNPVREEQLLTPINREDACAHYQLDAAKPVIFLTGGSLGARTLNEAVMAAADILAQSGVQLLWQCGKLYEAQCKTSAAAALPNVSVFAFMDRMDMAYAAANLVVCRSGALTIAELCLLGKAALLVPSPNVAEDHQTKNAQALVAQNAAEMLPDAEAVASMLPRALALLHDENRLLALKQNALKLAPKGAADTIAREVLKLAGWQDNNNQNKH